MRANSLLVLTPEKTRNDRRNLHNASLNFQWKKVPGKLIETKQITEHNENVLLLVISCFLI